MRGIKRPSIRSAAIPLVIGVVLMSSACGGGATSSESSQAAVASTASESSSSADTSATDATADGWTGDIPLPKKKVGILAGTLGAEVVVHWVDTNKAGVESLGWDAEVVDGKNDPKIWGQAISSFVQKDYDAIIVIGGLQFSTFAQQLKDAKAAGIPIIHNGIQASDPDGYMDGDYAPSDAEFGTVMGNYLAEKFPAGTEFVTLTLKSCELCNIPVPTASKILTDAGWVEVGTSDMALDGDLAGQAKKMSVDLLRANPTAKVLLTCCDFVATFSAPALDQAGFPEVITAVRYDDLSVLDLIRKGDPVVTASVNNDDFILYGIGALASYFAQDTPLPKTAPEDLAAYSVVDSSNLPPEGEYYDSPAEALEKFSNEMKATYTLEQ